MLPERADLSRRMKPDELPELMDGPCSYEEFRACLVDLGQVNRMSLGYRPTLAFVEELVRRAGTEAVADGAALHILDVGCGGGDMLRRIEAWARRKGVAVKLTGIDLNPYAERAAREFKAVDSAIAFTTGDAFSYEGPVDVVISSLLTHHLAEAEVVRFVAWMESRARLGWFVNDLAREQMPYRWFGVLARLMRWHRFVLHDGPVSFRRSFREADWVTMLAAAGVPYGAARMTRWTPGRLCVARYR